MIVSEKFYQQFDEKDQKIIRQAEENAKVYARAAADDRNEEKIEEIQKSGTQILTLDEMTRTEMKQASAGVREAIRKKVSKKIADAYMGEK